MNPLPPVHVQTGDPPTAGDSSLSTHNDEEESGSINSAENFLHCDHSLPTPENLFSPVPQNQYHRDASNPTPRYSNRARTTSNSDAVVNATRGTAPTPTDNNIINNSLTNVNDKVLIIRITTRPINSWSPQVVHADGTSRTMTIDLPEELANNPGCIVITQQGWQDLYHIIATAVAKNTSESILLFWFCGVLLIVLALVLLFPVVKGISSRLSVLVGVLIFTSILWIFHTVVRRVRVQRTVRKCVEECFYDAESAAVAANEVVFDPMDAERQQVANPNEPLENERENTTGNVLDGLQELEDVANVDAGVGDLGFGRALRKRLKSTDSSVSQSHKNNTNRQRLNTGGDSSVSSAMIFEDGDRRRNRATSRDGMYCVSWKWEYLGLDAVVKISWK
jgi:hypothetical protein